MILTVNVARELIEQAFATGYSSRGLLTVTEGVPPGSRLRGVFQWASDPRTVVFVFDAGGTPGRRKNVPVSIQCEQYDSTLQRLALEMAVDSAWATIQAAATDEVEGDVLWWNVEAEIDADEDEFRLLVGLKLAETHPEHPCWIREIAEL